MPEQISLKDYAKYAYGEWWKFVDIEEAKQAHTQNIQAVKAAIDEFHGPPDRPIKILAVNGSSRSNVESSCAHELSNSQLLLRSGLEAVQGQGVDIEEVNLRDYKIEYCNSCYSTTSALCNFPCTCFPFDPMQLLYPKVLRSDVLLLSTGVNQSAMSSRLKAFTDRLISVDGGYYIPPEDFVAKDYDYKNRMVATSLNQPVHYDQRMHGRTMAFFISSKDQADDIPVGDDYYDNQTPDYVKMVADPLYVGFHDYGFFFAEPWLASFSAVVEEDMSFDKMRMALDKNAKEQAKRVVLAAVELAKKFRYDKPPKRPHPPNRT